MGTTEEEMRFGKMSATLLIVAGAMFVITVLCKPG